MKENHTIQFEKYYIACVLFNIIINEVKKTV